MHGTRVSRRNSTIGRGIAALVIMLLICEALFGPAQPRAYAAGFSIGCGDTAGLIAAINAANTNGQADTINLAAGCTYILTSVNVNVAHGDATDGPTGLPSILPDGGSALTINGNGATIARASGAPIFRIMHIEIGVTLTLNNLTISGGSLGAATTIDGGGIVDRGAAALTINNSTFANNSGGAGGGGLSIYGPRTIINGVTFVGNNALIGGGLHSNSTIVNITNSTFSGNSASNGGGAENRTGAMTILNSTFSGNTASGGGASIQNQTLFGSTITLQNTIVAAGVGSNCNVALTDGGNNLQYPGASCGTGITVANPLLGPLADNGGPTLTHALLPGSPAIDAGFYITCAATDQRGISRPQGSSCDIGAFEQTTIFFVTNTNDAGAGSLRQAILNANLRTNSGGPDAIYFNIAGAGVHTIALTSGLPPITDPVFIDGTTQPGASCASWPPSLQIELDGSGILTSANGLNIYAGNSTVRGLVMHHFNDAIYLDNVGGNTIQCNFFGTDATGLQDRGNDIQSGVWVNSIPNNTIGGATPGSGNLFAGTNLEGLRVVGPNATGNLVQGNYIGTNVSGTAELGSHRWGILVTGGSNQIVGNVIAGSLDRGIWISYIYATGNLVQANAIGTDMSGLVRMGNSVGILIDSGAANNTIGGTTPGTGNRIANNTGPGVALPSAATLSGTGNRIQHNAIYDNGGPGIDLGNDGVTPNDPGDGDAGANNLQNTPAISTADIDQNGNLIVQYRVDSLATSSAYPLQIEFFATGATGNQGRTFIMTDILANPGARSANLGNAGALGVAAGERLVASATDSNGNTSEFAAPVAVTQAPKPARIVLSPPLLPGSSVPIGAPAFAVSGARLFDIVATIADANGAVVTNFNGPVSLALRAGAGTVGALLSGTLTVNAIGGVAIFRGLSIDRPGSGYQLLASASNVPNTVGDPFDVLEPETEQPSNDAIDGATPLGATPAERAGWITTGDDADWFLLDSGLTGATVAISVTNLPADYDLALISDPRPHDTAPISDGVSLANITDASQIDAAGRLTSIALGESLARIGAVGHLPGAAQLVLNISSNHDTDSESILAKLPRSGRYYILVFSAAGAADASRPYRLSVQLMGGIAAPTPPFAQPIGKNSLPIQHDSTVRTIFLYNAARMRTQYPAEAVEIERLLGKLAPGSTLMAASNGVSIDLSGARGQLSSTALAALNLLYAAWDAPANHAQPAYANQVAQQIWYTLDRAIADAYPGTVNIVLVGGDDVIPFYRVPDETVVAPESDYYQELLATGALSVTAALSGSLRGGFIQTDDFYADRAPTAWRGRLLFVPDLGIGRLVERPSDIVRYLDAYDGSGYTINAGVQNATALVTGYDFVADEANQLSAMLKLLGFEPNRQPALDTLINDTWKADQLTGLWLGGQTSRHQLVSFNGHFTHNQLIGADKQSALDAGQLLQQPANYFRDSLIYAIGCHSGLSASDTAFNGEGAYALQTDFAQAVLQEGGNWIGNTGFIYADPKTTGYSQQLAQLFTEQIGRPINDTVGYAGAPIGEALARAKQQYLRALGPNGLSVSDEKAIVQMELYGLPFMRVKVPRPHDVPAPTPENIPSNEPKNGQFTRTITVTNSFGTVQVGDGEIPGVVVSVVQDSFKTGETIITSTGQPASGTSIDQLAPGRPVLPALTYDITLKPNPNATCTGRCELPQPRGVQLKDATTLVDIDDFRPHITTPVTDPLGLTKREPDMTVQGVWLPDLPYSFQRTVALSGTVPITSDRLLISPTQFNATDAVRGHLRRFQRMVFEVSYVDPPKADKQVLGCWIFRSLCNWWNSRSSVTKGKHALLASQALGVAQVQETMVLSTEVTLNKNSLPLLDPNKPQDYVSVSATYTVDGVNWQKVQLTPQSTQLAGNLIKIVYAVERPAPSWPLPYFAAFFEFKDLASNVKVGIPREIPVHRIFVPLTSYHPPPDLVGSISLSPSKRAFTAGEPVQITVTITNTGAGDAGSFWADLFINPSTPPTAANVTWNLRCGMNPCFGLAWQVGGLKAGQSVTLTSKQLPPGYSIWPGWFAAGTTDLYLYVDSYNPGTADGAVLESSERNNQFHLGGLTVTGNNPPLLNVQSAQNLPGRPAP